VSGKTVLATGDGFTVADVHCSGGCTGLGDSDGSPAERVIRFAAALLARGLPERSGGGRAATHAARRRVVSQATAALAGRSE
jgi:hypothetical protein